MPHAKSERLLSLYDEHWMIYVIPVTICLVLLVIAVFFFWLSGVTVYHSEWLWMTMFLVATALLLLSLHGLFLVILGESVSQIVVTNRRVVRFHDVIMFREEMLEVSFEKMKTVEAQKKGLIRTLLNYGELHFEGKISIDYVPHPNRVARDIEQALGML